MPSRALVLATLLVAAPSLAASTRIEISADGSRRVVLSDESPVAAAPATPGPATNVYGTVPDWSNTLRLQVGGLEAADLDSDGDVDLAVACYHSDSFPPYPDWHNYIYFNTGGALEATPSWQSADQVSTGEIRIGHLDDDVYPDLFAANGGTAFSPSVVYFGTATGPSTSPAWAETTNTWTNHAVLFDFDHDGDTDVFTANQGVSPLPFRRMYGFVNHLDAGGSLETSPSWQSDEESIQNFLDFGDMDGDGWEDLAVSKWDNGHQSGVYRNTAGVLATVPVWTTGFSDTDKGVGWADVDGDGDLDLALGHDPTLVFTNTGGVLSNTWTSTTITSFGHQDLAWADIDLDGYPELAEIHFSSGRVFIYENQAGVLETAASWSYDSAGAGTALEFADLTGNGFPDLVIGNSGDPSVMAFYNQIGVFADGFESGTPDAWDATAP